MIEPQVKFKFGFKRLIEEKKDKPLFNFPYLVVGAAPIELKKRTDFKLVNARELLNFDIKDNKISWLYDESGDKNFYFINITGVDADPSIKVNLDLSFSDAKLYSRMYNILGLDHDKENYFQLIKVEPIEGLPTVKLVQIPMADITPSVIEETLVDSSPINKEELVTLI